MPFLQKKKSRGSQWPILIEILSLSLSTQREYSVVVSFSCSIVLAIYPPVKRTKTTAMQKMKRHDWSERSFADHILGITIPALLGPPLDGGTIRTLLLQHFGRSALFRNILQ